MTITELLTQAIKDWQKLANDWHDRAAKMDAESNRACHRIAESYENLIKEAEEKING